MVRIKELRGDQSDPNLLECFPGAMVGVCTSGKGTKDCEHKGQKFK